MIALTENAAKEIRKIMQEQQLEENVFIRVGVKGGGCSGFTYTFDFDARKTRFDLDFESQGMQILDAPDQFNGTLSWGGMLWLQTCVQCMDIEIK